MFESARVRVQKDVTVSARAKRTRDEFATLQGGETFPISMRGEARLGLASARRALTGRDFTFP
jgi:hypothetical protein